jgi:FMN phosphatase YigB (HAD superfamily)
VAIEGAHALLTALRGAGVRTALIGDTGFSPGRVVRTLLDRVGLLPHLEVQIFSDEVRAPKPHSIPFRAALEGLGVEAHDAVHVGDLRRSDVAGARAAGMRSVRFRGRNDDADEARTAAGVIDCAAAECSPACERPEADVVVASYAELADRLRTWP